MKFSATTLVLATLGAGEALAATMAHGQQKHNHAARHVELMKAHNEHREHAKRDISQIGADALAKMLSLGVGKIGLNAVANPYNGQAWIGKDGPYTNEFFNNGTDALTLVVWGPWGSWVNVNQPQITVSIPANSSKVISFPAGISGAWAPIYNDTKLVNGQISETWGEFTFGQWGVVDVSREVNMKGRNMQIKGPKCVTDMNTCVFKCSSGDVCTYGYVLENCANGSQEGANYGTYAGAPSGGCGGMGDSAKLKTYLNYKS